jgi:putative transposase
MTVHCSGARSRAWATAFVRWYNHVHRHSGITYVTPEQRHSGVDKELLANRHDIYLAAREANPRRWSGKTRNWGHIVSVALNPERDFPIQTSTEKKVYVA